MVRSTVAAVLLAGTATWSGCAEERVAAAPAGRAAETTLFKRAIWDSGNAEVAGYVTREPRYGAMHDGEAVLITVKEDFDAERLVKADGPVPPKEIVTVMKLNTVTTLPTGVYTYRQMASAFHRRSDGRPLKLTTSSQEWCGITSKILTVREPTALLQTHSYFGDEGDRSFDVAIDADTVLGDSLPMYLRTLDFDEREPRRLAIVDNQLSNRAPAPEKYIAKISLGGVTLIEVPAGKYETIPVIVDREDSGARDVYYFALPRPHPLVQWERADGGIYRLRYIAWAPYWNLHLPEHVGAIDPARRAPEREPAIKGEPDEMKPAPTTAP